MSTFTLLRKQAYPIALRSSRPCPARTGGIAVGTVHPGGACSILSRPGETTAEPGSEQRDSFSRGLGVPAERAGRGGLARPDVYTIVLADDHLVVRQSLKRLLTQQTGLQLVGESGNGLETLSLVKQLQPDLLVTDLMMPGMNGLEVTRRVRLSYPGTKVVVVSSNGDEPYVAGALRCGAVGFVLKSVCVRYLLIAVRAALAGERFVSPPLLDPMA